MVHYERLCTHYVAISQITKDCTLIACHIVLVCRSYPQTLQEQRINTFDLCQLQIICSNPTIQLIKQAIMMVWIIFET